MNLILAAAGSLNSTQKNIFGGFFVNPELELALGKPANLPCNSENF